MSSAYSIDHQCIICTGRHCNTDKRQALHYPVINVNRKHTLMQIIRHQQSFTLTCFASTRPRPLVDLENHFHTELTNLWKHHSKKLKWKASKKTRWWQHGYFLSDKTIIEGERHANKGSFWFWDSSIFWIMYHTVCNIWDKNTLFVPQQRDQLLWNEIRGFVE